MSFRKNLRFIFRLSYKIFQVAENGFSTLRTRLLFYTNNIQWKSFNTRGVPFIYISPKGSCVIGKNFKLNNSLSSNPVGKTHSCIIAVYEGARLIIGNNVGMSFTSISCHLDIRIGDNVLIGAGTCIYDSDFHPINANDRLNNNPSAVKKKAILIEDNVFIGAGTMILKGAVIRRNSVVGAASVVTCEIPTNQVWAGNPARFIKNLID